MAGVGHCRRESRRRDDAHARDRLQPPALFTAPMPGEQFSLELLDPQIEVHQLLHERRQRCARQGGNRSILTGEHRDQFADPLHALGHDDAELGQVSPQGIHQHRTLADQQSPHAVKHQDALLVGALHRDKAHARPRHRFADGLRVRGIVLSPPNIGLHV